MKKRVDTLTICAIFKSTADLEEENRQHMRRDQISDDNYRNDAHSHVVLQNLYHQFWRSSLINELASVKFELDTANSELTVFDQVKKILFDRFGSVTGNFVTSRSFYLVCDLRFLVIIRNNAYRSGSNDIRELELEMLGERDDVEHVRHLVDAQLQSQKMVKISWHYRTSRGTDSSSLRVSGLNQTIRDEFYPWLPDGVDQFIQRYVADPAAVLVLYGPPGTGKTSFLRHLLLSQNINAMVTYDDKLLSDDGFFVNYLTDEDHNALIVEDADVFLSPREDGENTMMSKFLNVSDGLIKITNKKMIFTTNITQTNRIDSALLRPGRCFSAVEFRQLTPAEAERAATSAGVVQQDWQKQSAWSLAQIFNCEEQSMPARSFRVGFL